ncbi:uncharacterized protein [Nicotiana sylvestris]|uniref:uncharacterized protein n=1 Tax=Nicotiana sylvestris TaxID=4096 RepID=UPI00388C35C0
MRDHIIGEDYELWDIVTDGPLATTKKNVEGVDVPKARVDCTAEDLKKWEKNSKAKKWLVCGLGPDEYCRIQSCTTAKEIWDTLQVAHEGTPQVKRSRGTLLYSQYDNFSMKEGESIQEMYTRFTTLTNELKSLGIIILKEDKVEKILTRVLPVTWESKINVIQESKNIATLKMDELIGNLTTYELRRQTMKMGEPKKERSLALRIDKVLDMEDDEMAMITRYFKKYLLRGKFSSRAKCKSLEARANESDSKNAKLKDQVLELDTSVLELRFENSKLKLGTDGLKYSLISVSQLCDKGNIVAFTSTKCFVINLTTDKIILQGKRVNNIYIVGLSTLSENELTFLSVLDNDPLLWHKRLGHASLNQLNKLASKDLVIGLTNIKFICEACARGKQEYEDEAIGLVKDLTEVLAQVKVARKEGTSDGTGPSIQGNLIGGTDQRGIETNPLKEPVHDPVPPQQNMGETSSRH